MKNAIFSAATSTSTVYGNVASAIKDYILDFFPKEYFGYTHISTEISYRTLRRFSGGTNRKEHLTSKERPFLFIQPEYSGNDSDLFLYNTPIVNNLDNMMNGSYDSRFLSTVLKDTEKGYQLRFKMNHDKIDFNCRIQVDTLHEAIDMHKAMRNSLTWEKTMYYRASLESIIPRSIVGVMGRMNTIDINSNEDEHYIAAFLSRLNHLSKFPITYKIKNSSQTDEYFIYYNHNILITLSDLSVPSPNRNGMLDGFYELNFRISAEFNLPSVYYLENCGDGRYELDVNLVDIDKYHNSTEVIPLYTIKNLFSNYPHILGEYTYYLNFIFHVENEDAKKEEIDMQTLFENPQEDFDTLHIIQKAGIRGEQSSPYLKIILLKDSEVLEEGKDYEFDMSLAKLYLGNIDIDATYRCIIYLNLSTLNTRKSEYIDANRKDISKL